MTIALFVLVIGTVLLALGIDVAVVVGLTRRLVWSDSR
jgi:hypothetical protein